jgi:hypothetical protein
MSAISNISPISTHSPAAQTRPAQTISEKVRTCGSACFHVFDSNMFPWIRRGDLAFVRRFDFRNLSQGNLILVEREGRLRLTTVITAVANHAAAGESPFVVTQGSSSEADGPEVSENQFVGKVIRIHRRRRHIDLESASRLILGRLLARTAPLVELVLAPLRLFTRPSLARR